MKKPKKLTNIRLPKSSTFRRRSKAPEEKVAEALQNVPRITNETVAEHREEVLSSARKYIYPLQHSKNRVVRISIIIISIAIIGFFSYCGLAIYKFQSTSSFIYGVSQVIPFPIAKVGSSWVSYDSYLFELRRNIHYYQTQQGVDFSSKLGKSQLVVLKQQAMNQVIQDAIVKQLASEHGVKVTDQQVDQQIALVKQENRLGSSDRVLREVLDKYWGWSENDFRQELKQQLLQQAVVAKLDTKTNAKAESALNQLKAGADFATIAGQYSDDVNTKANGGAYGVDITPDYANLSPIITNELFALKPGQFSGIVNTGYTLEILKVLDGNSTTVHGAHIQFTFVPITTFTKPIISKDKPSVFINL